MRERHKQFITACLFIGLCSIGFIGLVVVAVETATPVYYEDGR